MTSETLLEQATRCNFGQDPYQIEPDSLGHRTRGSDASTFDTICITCCMSDRMPSMPVLQQRCTNPLPPKGDQ